MTARPFYDFLREHRRGETHDKISDELQALVEAVTAMDKPGKLVITIAMSPIKDTDAYQVTVETALKPPKTPPDGSLFYVTPENNLTKTSPQQILDLSGPTLAHKGVA